MRWPFRRRPAGAESCVAHWGGPCHCVDCFEPALPSAPRDAGGAEQPVRHISWEDVRARRRAGGVPGWEGRVGPFRADYGRPHVYARDVHSGAGNCVCGADLGHPRHVQAAPGVPIPENMRHP